MRRVDIGDGYVMLLDSMGDDLDVANNARASFGRRSEQMSERDTRLIQFLATSQPAHTMPFRHNQVRLEVKAPIFVARQWYRHLVGARYVDTAWSEASGRYIAYDGHWIPDVLRPAPANRKQGSAPGAHPRSDYWRERMAAQSAATEALYQEMIADGVAPEQARTILGLNSYTSWRWTASLQAAAHFVNLRKDPHAQAEIIPYACIVDMMCAELWPIAWKYKGLL